MSDIPYELKSAIDRTKRRVKSFNKLKDLYDEAYGLWANHFHDDREGTPEGDLKAVCQRLCSVRDRVRAEVRAEVDAVVAAYTAWETEDLLFNVGQKTDHLTPEESAGVRLLLKELAPK